MPKKSISQTPLLVKLDSNQLSILDSLCLELGCNRNKMINFAVKMLNSNLKLHRKCSLTLAYSLAVKELL